MTKEKNKDSVFFIKPFEVMTSYILFAKTWNIIKINYQLTNNVFTAGLMKAENKNAKYGYVSFSEWKSKETFIKSLSENSIFRFHHSSNGQSIGSRAHNLYKITAEYSKFNVGKKKTTSLMIFLEQDRKLQANIYTIWKSLLDIYLKQNIQLQSRLFNALYNKNSIGNIIMLNFEYESKKNKIINISDKYFKKLKIKYLLSLYKFESLIKKYNTKNKK